MAFRYRYTSQEDIKCELANFKLQRVDDIDRLLAIVSRYNDFNINDYNKLKRQAYRSLYPTRLTRLLKSRIYPLVKKSNRRKTVNLNNTPQNKTEYQHKIHLNVKKANDKVYKATNFRFENGVLRCGDFCLKNKKITKINNDILKSIHRKFKIKASRNGSFIFNPPQEISVLLSLVECKKKR